MESARQAASALQQTWSQEGDLEGKGGSKRPYEPVLENRDIHQYVPILFQLRFRNLAVVNVRLKI